MVVGHGDNDQAHQHRCLSRDTWLLPLAVLIRKNRSMIQGNLHKPSQTSHLPRTAKSLPLGSLSGHRKCPSSAWAYPTPWILSPQADRPVLRRSLCTSRLSSWHPAILTLPGDPMGLASQVSIIDHWIHCLQVIILSSHPIKIVKPASSIIGACEDPIRAGDHIG